jgi:hypothetical protein
MKTFDCPKCGASVNYEPNALAGGTARCAYCQSQLALPDELRGKPAYVISQIDINVGPHVKAAASKVIWLLVLIPIFIVIIVLAGVLGALGPIMRSVRAPNTQVNAPSGPSGSRTNDPANSFAQVVLTFGSEGIGPGMMTGARSIAVDATGRIYVGEYSSGRVQVFDPAGQFITQWMVDPKMPLRGMAVDRQGTVYIAQRGTITRYEGGTGKSLGQLAYKEGIGFNDLTATPDGGLLCSWYMHRDDIVRFNAQGEAVSTIRAAISTVADRPELDTSVAMDGLGNIYALGSFTNGIFKFSSNGKFLNRFGGPGNQPGQISASHAIAVDGKGRVFVSDSQGVQVFDSDGRYLTVFKPGGVAFGMTFNDKNELFIATGNKVTKFVVNQ